MHTKARHEEMNRGSFLQSHPGIGGGRMAITTGVQHQQQYTLLLLLLAGKFVVIRPSLVLPSYLCSITILAGGLVACDLRFLAVTPALHGCCPCMQSLYDWSLAASLHWLQPCEPLLRCVIA